MRHRMDYRKLGRTRPHRQSLLRNLTTSLFEHEKIITTLPKAKELRRLAEKMITLGKRGDLHARRQVLAVVRDESVVKRLFDTISPRYQDRPGGYTRIIKLHQRVGDAAPMAAIELVGPMEEKAEKPKKIKKPTLKAAPREKPKAKDEAASSEEAPEKKAKAKAAARPKKTKPAGEAAEGKAKKERKGKKEEVSE